MNYDIKKLKFRLKVLLIFIMLFVEFFANINVLNPVVNASTTNNNTDNFYISENNYESDMKSIVEPYINARMESGYINGDEDVKLYYEKYEAENAKASIVISHGYTESLEKYHEIIYYFLKNGYNVFGIEHRGHGRSGTLGIADKTQIDVKNFDQYVTDFKSFMDEIVIPNKDNKKIFLFAHSMGGAIGTKFLEDYPNYFDAAILNAPMLEVNTGNIPKFLAEIIVDFEVAIGNGGAYVLGKKPYTPVYNKDEIGTTSLNRYEYFHNIVVDNEKLQRGGASYNWTKQAFITTEEIVKEKNASKVEIPVLLFQAGHDTYVKPEGENKFAKAAKDCKIIKVDNSRHEIYFEKDEIQRPYLKEVFEFYDKN
ncbi:alpha/beta hydrolase [Clostridium chromiireducens]|uniref:Alpha/beta hydrolase n=1 Tax=Clostridium chromiireducens TaxID=225345 RepID=A0A399IM33_9CLOT|nr:alpha/beta hydrolase [Clostridium chromiireducens]RII33981.1 alpha/beta hydrolase [Clostridium chromiireducens]